MKKLFVLVFVFLLTVFSACGGDNGGEGGIIEGNGGDSDEGGEGGIIEGNGGDSDEGGELTIAVLFDGEMFNYAARQFEETHGGRYTVNVIEYTDWESYGQTISTALMSGRGEDIISVSPLAWQRLANAGRLVDLNEVMSFPSGMYYQSVLDAYLHGGGRYVIPLNFIIEAWRFPDGVEPLAWLDALTLENLTALSQTRPDTLIFGTISGLGSGPVSVAEMFFNLNFNEFIDMVNRTANVDNERFISLLESVEALRHNIGSAQMGEDVLLWEDALYSPAMASGGVIDYSGMILAANDNGQSLVQSFSLTAINANSENKELAARFIEFLISEEFQSSPNAGFFNPVNVNASSERAALLLESVRAEGYEPENFDLQKNIGLFNELAERAAVFGTSDPLINNFITEEMARFFNGEVSAAQAANNLQARLTTYLNE